MKNRTLAKKIVSKICKITNLDTTPKYFESLVDAVEQIIEAAQHRVQPTPLSLSPAEILGDNSRRG